MKDNPQGPLPASSGDVAAAATALPVVSVVIVNHNHGTLVADALRSVLAQTYPAIECVVVDDASTDRSGEVLCDLAERHPSVRVLARRRNGGALRASLDGLAATSGPFVHFLDADDLVFPTFVETHVAAHLSLRAPVGFTCCDMVVSADGKAIACCDGNISRYRNDPACRPAERRPAPTHLLAPDAGVELLKVEPWYERWAWSATSAIVYRRCALDLLADAQGLERIANSTDTFFCQGINAIAGSAIIDAPLAVYRLHGSNDHFRALPLDHTITFDKERWREKQMATIAVLIDHVIARRQELTSRFWDGATLLEVLRRLCLLDPGGPSPARIVRAHRGILAEAVGRRVLRRWLWSQTAWPRWPRPSR